MAEIRQIECRGADFCNDMRFNRVLHQPRQIEAFSQIVLISNAGENSEQISFWA